MFAFLLSAIVHHSVDGYHPSFDRRHRVMIAITRSVMMNGNTLEIPRYHLTSKKTIWITTWMFYIQARCDGTHQDKLQGVPAKDTVLYQTCHCTPSVSKSQKSNWGNATTIAQMPIVNLPQKIIQL